MSLILSACAGVQQSREQPTSWAQTQAEVSELPVGRIVAVERMTYVRPGQLSQGGMAGVAGAIGPAAIALAPVIDVAKNGDWFYRYSILLKSTNEIVQRDEFALYGVGDCVALRNQPYMVVPAFSGICD